LRKEITNDKVLKWAIGVLSHMRKSDLHFFDEDTNTFIYTQTNNVYAPTITKSNTGVAANWLGYFNILMLCLFVPNKNNNMDITCDDTTTINPPTNWDWNNIGEITIVFDGINSVSKIDYICNTITNNLEIIKKEVKEEVCGDMILSPYLKLGGGNTIDNSGLIESCHCLCFERSGRRIGEEMNYVKLEYEYVYL
jgi:hypothetical protein